MNKTVLSMVLIVGVVLLVAVGVTAASRWEYNQYGTLYNPDYPFSQYPQANVPAGVYAPSSAPMMSYPSSISSDYRYAYSSRYPYAYGGSYAPRGGEGQFCGLVSEMAYGCDFGLVCDYTKTGVRDAGVCVQEYGVYPKATEYPYYYQSQNVNYPYNYPSPAWNYPYSGYPAPSMNYPYYYSSNYPYYHN